MRRGILILAAIGMSCASARRGGELQLEKLPIAGVELQLRYNTGVAADARKIASLVGPSLEEVSKAWGALEAPLTIEVLADHAALEEAAEKSGHAWLRAWARYDVVFIQAPSTWGLFAGEDSAVREMLIHELTHAVMYQRAASASDWQWRGFPLWFREGMASTTARQEYRRGSVEDLAVFLRANPGSDPIRIPEAIYQTQSLMVYTAAHHAFVNLQSRFGEESVRALLRHMHDHGASFSRAFVAVMKMNQEDFEAEFLRFVRSQDKAN